MAQCTAKSKSTGERCKRPAVKGMTVCRYHGGKTPVGIAAPGFVHGRRSKHMPSRLLELYSEALQDPEQLALTDDIALVDTRISELLRRIDSGESGEAWKRAREAHKALKDGLSAGDLSMAKLALGDLDDIIKKGMGDYAAWGEVGSLLDRRERLVRSERRRLMEAHQMITIEQAMLLMAAIVSLVREHVHDARAINAISDGIRRLNVLDSRPAGAP